MNKKKLLHIIMSRLGDNWCNSGVGRNEKAYAWTKNKAAADALTEILHAGYVSEEWLTRFVKVLS